MESFALNMKFWIEEVLRNVILTAAESNLNIFEQQSFYENTESYLTLFQKKVFYTKPELETSSDNVDPSNHSSNT